MKRERCYSELIELKTFEERFEYLKLNGTVGFETFGFDRYLNQALYRSQKWRRTRNEIILRDDGCDLGIEDRLIGESGFFYKTGEKRNVRKKGIVVHHMNPILPEDLENEASDIFNPEYLICVSEETHRAIHYGDADQLPKSTLIQRSAGDTCPWVLRNTIQ